MGDADYLPDTSRFRTDDDIVNQAERHYVEADLRIDDCAEGVPDFVWLRKLFFHPAALVYGLL